MTKTLSKDDTLQELWAVKDETFARFGSAAKYFEYLGMKPKRSADLGKSNPLRSPASRAKRTRTVGA